LLHKASPSPSQGQLILKVFWGFSVQRHYIATTLVIGVLVVSSCRTVQHCKPLEPFSQADWDSYYSAALELYNDPTAWLAHGVERPVAFSPHPTLAPWGTRPGRDVISSRVEQPSNLVYVHIPVEDTGEEGQGVPHVHVVFEHPSRKIVMLYVAHVVF